MDADALSVPLLDGLPDAREVQAHPGGGEGGLAASNGLQKGHVFSVIPLPAPEELMDRTLFLQEQRHEGPLQVE